MKRVYDKPYAQKVAFSYQDQVMALSGGTGDMSNRDDTEHCQFRTVGVCNKYWTPAEKSSVSAFNLTDCSEYPTD